ncbi:aldehyde:ferredoxin oxidoreductase [Chloroflexales bacterium ZM16-3]|nr:aldehyde:ferredoxin oxidoreductase [Chloroflexales bacterium ZM16-3]
MALRTLTVDLERGHVRQQLPATVERDYLGGRGAIAWLLWSHLPADTPPLAPENLLIFSAGPLAGTGAFATGGFVVGTRSPITGSIGYSWCQGHWGAALRQSGYDLLIIRGQAPEWCYLVIDHDQVRLRSASHLQGHDTKATDEAIRAELGDGFRVSCLGPAGEAEVAYASIVAEGRYMAEPAGTGVVMGNKRLKAIAVRGGPPITIADERRLAAAMDVVRRRVESSQLAASLREIGSSQFLSQAIEWGALTEHNGRDAHLSDGVTHMRSSLTMRGKRESRGCEGCPMPCYFDTQRRPGETVPLPELELVAGFGARCGISSPDTLLLIANRCLMLGLDPASASAAVAFLMECQSEGLNLSGTLPWGNDEAVLAALERLAVRQERRDMLSLGIGEIADVFWGGAAFAPQVKGLAMPALDPRALTEIALAMATAPIGGDYRYAMPYEELIAEPPAWLPDEPSHPQAVKGKVLRLIWHERFAAMLDSAGICRRLGLMAYQISPGELLALITATGSAVNGSDMARIGERIITVERLFARRYADNGAVDDLPARWRESPLDEGRAAGHLPRLADLLVEYYRRHGWGADGNPTAERLAELGIKA